MIGATGDNGLGGVGVNWDVDIMQVDMGNGLLKPTSLRLTTTRTRCVPSSTKAKAPAVPSWWPPTPRGASTWPTRPTTLCGVRTTTTWENKASELRSDSQRAVQHRHARRQHQLQLSLHGLGHGDQRQRHANLRLRRDHHRPRCARRPSVLAQRILRLQQHQRHLVCNPVWPEPLRWCTAPCPDLMGLALSNPQAAADLSGATSSTAPTKCPT